MKKAKSKLIISFCALFSSPLFLMLLSPVSFISIEMIVAVIFSLLVYLFFLIGFVLDVRASPTWSGMQPAPIQTRGLFVLTILAPLSAVYGAFYYTGSVLEGYLNLFSGVSNYNAYQKYFSQQGLGDFSLLKLPAILSLAFLKAFFYYMGYYHFFVRRSLFSFFAVLICILSIVHVGISRGTSYELFEVLIYFFFLSFAQYALSGSPLKIISIFRAAALICLVLWVYNFNIALRYAESGGYTIGCDTSLCADPDSMITRFLPGLASLTFKLSGYFNFGYIYMSEYFASMVAAKPLLFFLPEALTGGDKGTASLCLENVLSCGAMWVPPLELYINQYSFFGTLMLVFGIGIVSSILFKVFCLYRNYLSLILLYFHLLIVFSLPIGFLFSTSSANTLIYLISGFLLAIQLSLGVVRGYEIKKKSIDH